AGPLMPRRGAEPPRRARGVGARRSLGLYEQRDQRLGAALRAPVAVQPGVERRAFGQQIRGVEMLARAEAPRRAVAQSDLHLAAQDEDPLRLGRAVPLAAEPDRAVAQLIAG